MKKIISSSWRNLLVGVVLCSVLSSFIRLPGAHSVQVYLDSKLVIDQYVDYRKNDVPKVTLNPAEKVSQLIVKYNECGRTVTGRVITLKDENNKVLKDWHFEGAGKGYQDPMTCAIKDILALKSKSNTLKLYYSSNDFREGQHFANLVISGNASAAIK